MEKNRLSLLIDKDATKIFFEKIFKLLFLKKFECSYTYSLYWFHSHVHWKTFLVQKRFYI